jgi:protease-4
MKSFFKYLLASILGVIIGFAVIFLILAGVIGAMISVQDKPVSVKDNTILLLKFEQPINDRKSSIPSFALNFSNFGASGSMGLNEILANIKKAKKDQHIKGIYLQLSGLQTGVATIEEIRNALIDFKTSGKFIIAFSDTYTQGSFYLASIADHIYLNPGGSVNFIGLSADLMFYKKALEKLDIEPEVIRHGRFKSAVEPFMYDKMSPENREQIKSYMGSIWNHIVNRISQSRNVSVDSLNAFADSLMLWDNKAAERYGIVDGVLYKDQVLDTLASLMHITDSKNLEFISYQKYLRVPDEDKDYSKNKIAIIYAEGDIVPGEVGEGYISSDALARTIRNARQDSAVKAIVFRVNSPGGSALASEVIWRELKLAREVKPVIASMGDVAASGGYYIVTAVDSIVASPNTITGSIGVFGILVNAGDFFNNKLGITTDVEKTNTWSDFGSIYRPLADPERKALQNMVDDTYRTFVTRVSDGRGLPFDNVDNIGEGRVWSGVNAKGLGLVDTLGGLTMAVDIAVKAAGVGDYRIVELPRQEDAFTQLFREITGDIRERLIREEVPQVYKQYRYFRDLIQKDRIQTRLPFDITVH